MKKSMTKGSEPSPHRMHKGGNYHSERNLDDISFKNCSTELLKKNSKTSSLYSDPYHRITPTVSPIICPSGFIRIARTLHRD